MLLLHQHNLAYGLGGGAIFSHDAIMTLKGLKCTRNAAFDGGGGVIYWQGTLIPKITPWCDLGWYTHPEFECTPETCEYKCKACHAGSYQSKRGAEAEHDCLLCEAGKFTSTLGASMCMGCSPGTFSTTVGASSFSSCTACYPGSYSESRSNSECPLCKIGEYSSAFGSTSCTKCHAGEYLTLTGANDSQLCIACDAGTFSMSGAGECVECGYGTFSSTRSSACIACSAGTFSTVSRAIDNTSCVICKAGTFSEQGAAICSSCEPGKYTSADGNISPDDCRSCEAGTFSTMAGATNSATCAECGAGSYSRSGSPSCSVCKSGKYSAAGRAESSMTCIQCILGSISAPGSAYCPDLAKLRKARSVFLSDENMLELPLQFEFPFNYTTYNIAFISSLGQLQFGLSDLNKIMFKPKFSGFLNNLFSDVVLSYIEDKSSFLIFNDTTQVSIQWTNWGIESLNCLGCLSDFSLTFQVSFFQNGSIITSFFGADQLTFEDGTLLIEVQSRTDILPSSLDLALSPTVCFHISPAVDLYSDYHFETYRCQENVLIAPICPPGTFLSENMICMQCEAGKYQTREGMMSAQNCTMCMAGKYSMSQASSAAELCINCSDSVSNCTEIQDSFYFRSGRPHKISNYYEDHLKKRTEGEKNKSNTSLTNGNAGIIMETSQIPR